MTGDRVRRVPAALLILLALLGIGWLARAPYSPPGSSDAVLRLSWRMRFEPVEHCRPRTQAELDALPVHMRTPQVCTTELVLFRLIVNAGDTVHDTLRVRPGGAKGDRPVYVFREYSLSAGPQAVRIALLRDGIAEPVLSIDTIVEMRWGEVRLVTLASDGKTPVVR